LGRGMKPDFGTIKAIALTVALDAYAKHCERPG
jgi:hypothetical protein